MSNRAICGARAWNWTTWVGWIIGTRISASANPTRTDTEGIGAARRVVAESVLSCTRTPKTTVIRGGWSCSRFCIVTGTWASRIPWIWIGARMSWVSVISRFAWSILPPSHIFEQVVKKDGDLRSCQIVAQEWVQVNKLTMKVVYITFRCF